MTISVCVNQVPFRWTSLPEAYKMFLFPCPGEIVINWMRANHKPRNPKLNDLAWQTYTICKLLLQDMLTINCYYANQQQIYMNMTCYMQRKEKNLVGHPPRGSSSCHHQKRGANFIQPRHITWQSLQGIVEESRKQRRQWKNWSDNVWKSGRTWPCTPAFSVLKSPHRLSRAVEGLMMMSSIIIKYELIGV